VIGEMPGGFLQQRGRRGEGFLLWRAPEGIDQERTSRAMVVSM